MCQQARLWAGSPTYLLHGGRCGQEALPQQLLPGLLVLHLDLRHHVTGHVAQVTVALSSVEPVCVFISVNLGSVKTDLLKGDTGP